MSGPPIPTSLQAIRRLAVTKQHLAGPLPTSPTREDIRTVVRDLAYVQWDPVPVVAPSHLISLWSRIGDYHVSDLDRLLWKEKRLFLCWTPIADIVPMEDYPLHHSLMRRYPDSLSDSWGNQRERARKFLAEHRPLAKALLAQLKNGPRVLTQFDGYVRKKRSEDGWTPGSEISLMLSYLHMRGEVMVVGHEGNQNLWGLSEDFLPKWAERVELPQPEVEEATAERAVRALGTATPREIHYYFVRGRYLDLKGTLQRLQKKSRIRRIHVSGMGGKDERYVHEEDVPLLESVTGGDWEPRMSLLAPFDNLICGRDRTKRIFGFEYVHEQFVPKEKRKFGTYVLPILWGERLIGRIDPQMDREHGRLQVNSVHAEPGAPIGREVASGIAETIGRFADFLGAEEVTYTSRVPSGWRQSLR